MASGHADLPVACGTGCGPGVWVSGGAATRHVTGNTLNVVQGSERATLNWRSFDIGPDSRVVFDQPSSSAIALNRIFQGSPSQIRGQILANGQVYLINQNGILFGQGSRVNVNTLVASTLDVDDAIFNGVGVVGAINEGTGRAAFQASGPMGGVDVAGGARIETTPGGRVMLLGPDVRNAGTVSTPDGQAVLAGARDAVYLAASSDPNLRGLLVEVGSGGEATNLGEVMAARGNVSLVGLAVNQSGRVQATTSTSLAGSVRLVAQDRARVDVTASTGNRPQATRGGALSLGDRSVTEVLPDRGSGERAVDAQVQPRSQVALVGEQVRLRPGAEVRATGGDVRVTAARDPSSAVLPTTPKNASRVVLEPGSRIDVSGDDSTVLPMSRNTVGLELRGSELRDAPAQRDGPLRNQSVSVDVRRGTPLADASGAIAGIQRGVGERLAPGGSVSLRSEGDIHLMPGSRLDASGGAVRYEGGYLPTTTLTTRDRRLVHLVDADPAQPYTGVLGDLVRRHPKWDQEERFRLPSGAERWEDGYVEGRDAGSVELVGRSLVLAGELGAGVTRGANQRRPSGGLAAGVLRPYDQMPLGGLVTIGDEAQVALAEADFRTPDVRFGTLAEDPYGPDDALAANLELVLDPIRLAAGGVARLAVYGNGHIEVPSGTELRLPAGGGVSLVAGQVEIAGAVAVPAGTVRLEGRKTPTVEAGGSRVTLADSAYVDVRGLWVDERVPAGARSLSAPLLLDGGSVSLRSSGPLTLNAGSRVDASAGALVGAVGEMEPGKGGRIDLAVAHEDARPLDLRGTLSAFGFVQGGSLTLRGAGFRIGGEPGTAADGTLTLDPGFFGRGGFQSFDLRATHAGIHVKDGARIDLVAENLVLPGRGGQAPPAGVRDRPTLAAAVLPSWQRRPTHLSLGFAPEIGGGSRLDPVSVGAGSVISGEPGARVSLSSETGLLVDGEILAPGGAITLTLPRATRLDRGYDPALQIRLGAAARLDARGTAVNEPAGAVTAPAGELWGGGVVSVVAERGYLIGEAGAGIDVSGAAAAVGPVLRAAPGARGRRALAHAPAGAIELSAAEGILYAGELAARPAAVPGASGGRLSISLVTVSRESGNPVPGLPPFPGGPREVVVGEVTVPEVTRGVAVPAGLNGLAYVVPSRLAAAGFDAVALRADPVGLSTPVAGTSGRVRFLGDLALGAGERLVLDAPVVASTGGLAALRAPYVALGHESALYPFTPGPTGGTGALQVEAGHIDLVGSVTLNGFGAGGVPAVSLRSSADLRLRGLGLPPSPDRPAGSLQAVGDVRIEAARVYPSTLTRFMLRTESGTITFAAPPGQIGGVPLSASGLLAVEAPRIVQGGVLAAPFGTIELRASERLELLPGSLTLSSGAGSVVPFGQTQFGRDWVYALAGSTRLVDGVPGRSVALQAPSLVASTGAVVDVSGGGDLLAYEFLRGPGGSRDVLLTSNPEGAFAVLPTLGSLYAPYDPFETQGFGPAPGETVHLTGAPGLPAGEYAKLPAHYALLPGAYLVTPVAGVPDLAPGTAPLSTVDGTPVVAGKDGAAGTDRQASRWSRYLVEDGARVRTRAEYRETLASAFFASDAAGERAGDAGRVSVAATTELTLAARLVPTPAPGRGARVDVSAERLAVVQSLTGASDRVEILADDLNQLGAASLLLGGSRASAGDALRLTSIATGTRVEPGVRLSAPELMLIARDTVAVGRGAELRGTGPGAPPALPVDLSDDGALLRVASAGQVEVRRQPALGSGSTGTIEVAAGAVLAADDSITLDASRDTRFLGDLPSARGSVSLGSSRISLGDAPAGVGGLVIGARALGALDARELILSSSSSIDLHGGLTLGSPMLERLVLDAGAVRGIGGGDSGLAAATVVLGSRRAAPQVPPAEVPAGTLSIEAGRELLLSEGAYAIQGYERVSLRAGEGVRGEGVAALDVAADLDLTTPWLSGASGAQVTLAAAGSVDVRPVSGDNPAPASLGAGLTVTGRDVSFAGRAVLPSGQISLSAVGPGGDLRIEPGAVLDVGGVAVDFGEVTAGSPGGEVRLASTSGSVEIGRGSLVDVTGSIAGGPAGRVDISATAGTLRAHPLSALRGRAVQVADGGTLRLDVGRLDSGTLGTISAWTTAGGFSTENRIRVRTGDLTVDGIAFAAREVTLSADAGGLSVRGTLDASGPVGGRISLSSGGDLALAGDAHVLARASQEGGAGGLVLLETLGALRLAATDTAGEASIDVSAGVSGEGGQVMLVAPREGLRDLRVVDASATIDGASRIDLVGVATYASGTVDASTLRRVRDDAAAFKEGGDAVKARLDLGMDDRVHVLAGVTIQSDGDLALETSWDLQAEGWRPGGEVGLLTLRAGGDLLVNASLSDGVGVIDPLGFGTRETVAVGPGWSFRLIAGADLDGADPLAVRAGIGDVRIADGERVRTGSGSIDVVAGRDVVLGGARASIYTVGENRGPGPLFEPMLGEFLLGADFLHRGGDLRVHAGRDVRAVAATGQLVNQWLSRIGGESQDPGGSGGTVEIPTAWAVAAGEFRQHLGALGGGDVTVEAGRRLDRVSVSVASTGRPEGTAETPTVVVEGGGTLRVSAGEDVRGGVFYLARGTGSIVAGGALASPVAGAPAPILALGDGSLEARAGGDLALATILNPTVLPRGRNQGWRDDTGIDLDNPSYFFTYAPTSAVRLSSLAGDVRLLNDTVPVDRQTRPEDNRPEVALETDVTAGFAGTTYPGTLAAWSLSRDVVLERPMRLFPAARGQLELLAARDVTTTGGPVTVLLSDTDPLRLPSVGRPAVSFERAVQQLGIQARDSATVHAGVPVHTGDPEPVRVIARAGSVRGVGENALTLAVAKAARVSAGVDISNLNLLVQHSASSDQTVVRAGRDLTFPTLRSGGGQFTANTNRIEAAGPGRLDLIAGRHVDLGTSAGVLTVGNATNPALPDGGADVALLAGLAGPVDYAGFAEEYLRGGSEHADALAAYLARVGAPSEAEQDPVDRLLALPVERQAPFLVETVLFSELLASGEVASSSGSGDYTRGFAAIAAMFPGEDHHGDLSLLLSRITTIDGGSITLVAPGGRIDAGVTATTGLAKGAEDLGIVVQREGDIRAFLSDDFEVNESRVFTLDGGDIVIWSSTGDIDAGRGAKTAIAAPPPRVTFDQNGNALIEFPPAVEGSGIRTAVSTPGRAPGSVALFAPAGVVRAGDAGIEAAGDLTIGAVEVIGSDNIVAGGRSVGVPVAQTGSLAAGLTGVSNVAASATRATEQQAAAVAEKQSNAASQAAAEQALALITVDVIGLGP
jgi:filamentous hemagglutinin family protein